MTALDKQAVMEKFANTMIDGFANNNLEVLDDLVAEEVTLYTPRHFKPITNKQQVRAIIRALPEFIDGFNYDRYFIKGNQVVMEFKGEVDGMPIQGIDLFSVNDEGQGYQVEVFVRPSKSLAALAVKEDAFIADVMSGKISLD